MSIYKLTQEFITALKADAVDPHDCLESIAAAMRILTQEQQAQYLAAATITTDLVLVNRADTSKKPLGDLKAEMAAAIVDAGLASNERVAKMSNRELLDISSQAKAMPTKVDLADAMKTP